MPLAAQEALNALEGLAPVTYRYKHDDAGDLQVGFVAEDVPELVSTVGRTGIPPVDIIAVLTKVVQQQQERILTLEAQVRAVEQRIK